MKNNFKNRTNTKYTSIIKGSFYNILGYTLPLLFAFITIPILLNSLGTERFGLLNLIWIITGYSSFFDFGIGRSLTKIIAEKIGTNQSFLIPKVFWNSLYLMLAISLIVSICLFFITPYIINNAFEIPDLLKPEATFALYGLIISLPIIISTTGVRGTLEAYQQFGIINIVRVFLGIFTFLGPVLVLVFVDSLFWIVIFLLFIRIIAWLLYIKQVFKINNDVRNNLYSKFDFDLIRPLIRLSFWITIANIVGPIMLYSDRFFISAIISATALTYYATPYEIVTKLLLIPNALTTVLFPLFSASEANNPEIAKNLFNNSVKFTFITLFPIVFLSVVFSFDAMNLWLGNKFANESFLVLQILSLGVLINALAYIPFNYLQGIGKPKIPALLNLIEFPIYILFLWFFIKMWGITGAASIWTIRIIFDAGILFLISHRNFNIQHSRKLSVIISLCISATVIMTQIPMGLITKTISSVIFLTLFSILIWKSFLTIEEKKFFCQKLT